MTKYNKARLELGKGDYVLLSYQENLALKSVIKTVKKMQKKGKKFIRFKTLVRKAKKKAKNAFCSKETIRRMIIILIGLGLLCIKHKNGVRIISPRGV